MNLSFLDTLSAPVEKTVGAAGTSGTSSVHAAVPTVPAVPELGNTGDKISAPIPDSDRRPQLSPTYPQPPNAEITSIYAAVPVVPSVPTQTEQVYMEPIKIELSRWMAARCICPANQRLVWGSEASLYRDYLRWSEQCGQVSCSPEVFRSVFNESFPREGDGWQGFCLAEDFRAIREGIGPRRIQPVRLITKRVQ